MKNSLRKMSRAQGGFTLIELLVVIAIIGILAALILVSLGNARNKARDARIKSNISQMRILAEQAFDNANTYIGWSTEASVAAQYTALNADVTTNGGATGLGTPTAAAFCVDSTLNAAGQRFCLDSAGNQGNLNCAAGASAAVCD